MAIKVAINDLTKTGEIYGLKVEINHNPEDNYILVGSPEHNEKVKNSLQMAQCKSNENCLTMFTQCIHSI